MAEEADYKAFVQQSGFDYKRDLDRVMVNSAEGATLPSRGRPLRLGQAEQIRAGARAAPAKAIIAA